MAQETFVGRAEPGQVRELAQKLESRGMTSREIPHAIFSYTGGGIAATLYNSGKLVVQGIGANDLGAELVGAPPPAKVEDEVEVIGTDESGKGDYFGPLVVAAVYATPEERVKMRMGEIDDSKKLSNSSVRRIAAAIEQNFPHAIVSLAPKEYNEEYRRVGNLNKILAGLHARVIEKVADQVPCRTVLTDEFGDESLVRTALGSRASEFDLRQRPRAEEDPAVAAASILARMRFMRDLAGLGEEMAVGLPFGASDEVDRAARRLIQIHGREGLEKSAKLHFKNTQKLKRLF